MDFGSKNVASGLMASSYSIAALFCILYGHQVNITPFSVLLQHPAILLHQFNGKNTSVYDTLEDKQIA